MKAKSGSDPFGDLLPEKKKRGSEETVSPKRDSAAEGASNEGSTEDKQARSALDPSEFSVPYVSPACALGRTPRVPCLALPRVGLLGRRRGGGSCCALAWDLLRGRVGGGCPLGQGPGPRLKGRRRGRLHPSDD